MIGVRYPSSLTLLQNAHAVYCPERSKHRNVLLAGNYPRSHPDLVGLASKCLACVVGTAIVDTLDDAAATQLASLSDYLDTLDAEGCVICPGLLYLAA